MNGWEPAIDLAPGDQPLFLRIARAVADDIRRGRLRPGDALPGSRTLAGSLGVHRNTVLAAYRELAAEGWIATRPAGGTFVSDAAPDPAPRRFAHERQAVPARLGFDLPPPSNIEVSQPEPPGVLSFGGGTPDLRLVPAAALARAYRRTLKQPRSVLGYADPRGHPRLRAALAEMASALRGLAATAETLVVTRGSHMGFDLVARALIRPGDVVAVEAFGYRPAWWALQQAGARLAPVPVDAGGLDVDALARLCERERVRAVYVTPHHQYPTTVVLQPGRRLALLELARARRLAILEDDYDYEFHYDGRPVLPLASADTSGVVIYLGTLSKILAPGLRLGFVVAPAPLLERLAALRFIVDRQGDHAVEGAVAELLEDGEVQRHARRMRRIYRGRRDLLVELLEKRLAGALSFTPPAGGISLWARSSLDADAWSARALRHGLAVQTARRFAFDDKPRPFLRLGFAFLSEDELREAVKRLERARR
jgi:GntR family transcriptional regulator / MocR family aminotransferase